MKPGKPLEKLSAPKRCKLLTLTTLSVTLLVLSVTPVFIDPIVTSANYLFRIAKDSFVYNILTNEIAGALIETYIFNITNVDKFLAGEDEKIKVQEIGPFTYQEYRKLENFFLDEEKHTMRYTPHIYTRFQRQYSVADPKDLNVSVPNIPLLTMGSTMSTYPFWTQMGFNLLVNRLDSKPIINLTAQDFMWGYKEPLIALGNTLMPGWINFNNLGMLDRLYDQTVKDTIVVGASNADKFKIITINGEGGMKSRGYDPSKRDSCSTFVDTYEGLAYPTGLTPQTKLRLYRNVFCRILDLQYVGSKYMEFGPKVFTYRLSNSSFAKRSENDCLCGKICVDGMTDLSPCFYGFGVSFSQAHFLDADPKVYERIDGIKPEFEKHGSEFIVDPSLGTVLGTRLTIQLNVVVENADFNARTKPFSNIILPVLYFRIVQPELPDDIKNTFRTLYVALPYFVLGIQAVLLCTAVGVLACAVRLVRFSAICRGIVGLQMYCPQITPLIIFAHLLMITVTQYLPPYPIFPIVGIAPAPAPVPFYVPSVPIVVMTYRPRKYKPVYKSSSGSSFSSSYSDSSSSDDTSITSIDTEYRNIRYQKPKKYKHSKYKIRGKSPRRQHVKKINKKKRQRPSTLLGSEEQSEGLRL